MWMPAQLLCGHDIGIFLFINRVLSQAFSGVYILNDLKIQKK